MLFGFVVCENGVEVRVCVGEFKIGFCLRLFKYRKMTKKKHKRKTKTKIKKQKIFY